MNTYSLARATRFLTIAGVFILSTSVAQAHECSRHSDPNHKHCASEPPPNERIQGTATFATANPVTTDGLGAYYDGQITSNFQDNATTMQVAMNCTFNHFNVFPGGGSRRIHVDLDHSILTGIDSCAAQSPAAFSDTSIDIDCDGLPGTLDWAFDQLMRASPTGNANVCDLKVTDGAVPATMRLQNNMYHVNDCKGGKKKCKTSLEAMEFNYDGTNCGDTGSPSANVTIQCDDDQAGTQCNTWIVASTGPGCLTHESGGAGELESLEFSVEFVDELPP